MANIENGIRLVDSHCHLDFEDFDDDLPLILDRAFKVGVFRMLTISTSLMGFSKLIAIASEHEAIYCTVGIHPHNAQNEGINDPQKLIELLDHSKVIGIGESGLDFHYNIAEVNKQTENFLAHIQASRISGLPLIIHSRDADNEMGDILEKEQKQGEFPFILHCFTGGSKLASRAVELGGFISFSGIITFRNASELRAIASNVPNERLLIETDAPYLAPVPVRGKRNEPANLIYTFKELARIKNCSEEELAFFTTNNFFRLFSKMPNQDV